MIYQTNGVKRRESFRCDSSVATGVPESRCNRSARPGQHLRGVHIEGGYKCCRASGPQRSKQVGGLHAVRAASGHLPTRSLGSKRLPSKKTSILVSVAGTPV